MCDNIDCKKALEAESNDQLTLLALALFGPLAKRAIKGRCTKCKKQNLSRIWLGLVYLICAAICFTELPWKGPLFACIVALIWTGLLWKPAFGNIKS